MHCHIVGDIPYAVPGYVTDTGKGGRVTECCYYREQNERSSRRLVGGCRRKTATGFHPDAGTRAPVAGNETERDNAANRTERCAE